MECRPLERHDMGKSRQDNPDVGWTACGLCDVSGCLYFIQGRGARPVKDACDHRRDAEAVLDDRQQVQRELDCQPAHRHDEGLRLYDRPLSDAEIAQNYKVDVARFDGALLTTNVVVAASDYNGDLAADAYEVFGTWTFTGAPSATDGKLPNRVKVWTLQNGSWGRPEFIGGDSYTYVAGTSPATVKIEFGKIDPFLLIVR